MAKINILQALSKMAKTQKKYIDDNEPAKILGKSDIITVSKDEVNEYFNSTVEVNEVSSRLTLSYIVETEVVFDMKNKKYSLQYGENEYNFNVIRDISSSDNNKILICDIAEDLFVYIRPNIDINGEISENKSCIQVSDLLENDIIIKEIDYRFLDNGFLNPDVEINNSLTIGKRYYETPIGDNSFTNGYLNVASGLNSCAQGEQNQATGENSIASGYYSAAIGYASHAEGGYTEARGEWTHTEGYNTIVGENCFCQHVQGKYNIEDTEGKYAHIVGNGDQSADTNWELKRSNAHTLDWEGNAWFAGDMYVGGTGQDDENAIKVSPETEDETFNKMLEAGLVSGTIQLEDGTYLADNDGNLIIF